MKISTLSNNTRKNRRASGSNTYPVAVCKQSLLIVYLCECFHCVITGKTAGKCVIYLACFSVEDNRMALNLQTWNSLGYHLSLPVGPVFSFCFNRKNSRKCCILSVSWRTKEICLKFTIAKHTGLAFVTPCTSNINWKKTEEKCVTYLTRLNVYEHRKA